MIVLMVYYTDLDKLYFSLFDDIGFIFMNWKLKNLLIKNRFFHFYFLTIDFLVNPLDPTDFTSNMRYFPGFP